MLLIPVVIVLKSYMNEMDKNSDFNKVFLYKVTQSNVSWKQMYFLWSSIYHIYSRIFRSPISQPFLEGFLSVFLSFQFCILAW